MVGSEIATMMSCRGVRGATTADENSREAILQSTRQLLAIMIRQNGIEADRVASAIFTTTSDLDAEFPALAARQLGWLDVPLLCTNEIDVPGSLRRCVRILVHWNTARPQKEIKHVYLKGAIQLRPDLSKLPPVDMDELESWIAEHLIDASADSASADSADSALIEVGSLALASNPREEPPVMSLLQPPRAVDRRRPPLGGNRHDLEKARFGLETSRLGARERVPRRRRLPTRFALVLGWLVCGWGIAMAAEKTRPNILLAISDDQSYPYASAYGCQGVKTPAMDRVARMGVLFPHAFAPSPGCSPTRASILTGRYPWQNEHAGTHASSFSSRFAVYPDLLEAAGYHVGMVGKGWGPGNFEVGGFKRNPAGPTYRKTFEDAPEGVSSIDYAGAFEQFLADRRPGQPFCFWFGCHEPHRRYARGIGRRHGGDPSQLVVPAFLPDDPVVRDDLLDYAFEIAWFDRHLARMLDVLEAAGELDQTLIVVTSDNGMPFPRAKANLYEYGIHVPLAISWPETIPAGRRVDDLVNLVDLMPTFLEAAAVPHPGEPAMSGKSLLPILQTTAEGRIDPQRDATYAGRERHSSSRWNNRGYPQRAVRTEQFLYIRNFHPDRWPAGAPQKFAGRDADGNPKLGPRHGAYHDIDGSPTLSWLTQNADRAPQARYLQWAVSKRPAEELYDVRQDPACLVNLIADPSHAAIRQALSDRLRDFLRATGDPRILDGGDVFESYPRYSPQRSFPAPDPTSAK